MHTLNKNPKLLHHLLYIFIFVTIAFSQDSIYYDLSGQFNFDKITMPDTVASGIEFRSRNVLDKNNIRITFDNTGHFGSFKGDQSLVYRGEWPKNSGIVSIGSFNFYIGTKINDLNKGLVPVFVVSPGWDASRYPHDSLGWPLVLEPISGFQNPLNSLTAVSDNPNTWPHSFGKNWLGDTTGITIKTAQEAFFIVDDANVKRFAFYPDSTDISRAGLGLQVALNYKTWDNMILEDMVFMEYSIKNISTSNYTEVIMGFDLGASSGANIGSNNDWLDDNHSYSLIENMAYAFDNDNIGTGGFSPVPYLGFVFIDTVKAFQLNSCYCYNYGSVSYTDDQQLWDIFTPGNFDITLQNADADLMFGTDYFELNAGDEIKLHFALVFGWDMNDLVGNARIARKFFQDGFIDSTIVSLENKYSSPKNFELYQNFPNPFNPTTTIEYELAETSKVNIVLYDIIGKKVATLKNEKQSPGKYKVDWNAKNFSSGIYYYQLITDQGYVKTKKLVVIK